MSALIRIIFTAEDIVSMAEDLEVDPVVALERAYDWAKHIQDTATTLCSEQLASVVANNQP